MTELGKLCLILTAVLLGASMMNAQKPERVGYRASEFGKYIGYSQPLYSGWVRTSHYLQMSDGIKLAIDVIRPAKDGKPVEKPMPVVWNYYLYVRAEMTEGKAVSIVDISETFQTLVKHGYVIAIVDARGKGASYGRNFDPVTHEEGKYGYEITEWLAAQPWCNGNIGMFGHSYSANIEYMIASHAPPHLKAMFPSMAAFDIYQLLYPGGICRSVILEGVTESFQSQEDETPAAPVDEDTEGEMLAEARNQHRENTMPIEYSRLPFRDSEEGTLKPWTGNNLLTHVDAVNESGIAVYHWAGWFDVYIRDAFQWFVNLKNPQKITIGPWAHSDQDPAKRKERAELYATEMLRWFDYWLKGVENGIMDEPRINYALMETPDKWAWHAAEKWPLPGIKTADYYFSEGKTKSIGSINDGFLTIEAPDKEKGEDKYAIDYTTGAGELKGPRGPNRGMEDPDMSENDAKGLTYTTPPLPEDYAVVGHPVVILYVKSSATDGNFYAYLEEVDPDGHSHYITDGLLRASHRAEAAPPFDNMGLPWHRHYQADVIPLTPGEVAELKFDMMPTANVFNKGNRIRVTVTCANAGWDELPSEEPATITLLRNARYASRIQLPIAESVKH
jgi:putative CocE/NonD family hydrolase